VTPCSPVELNGLSVLATYLILVTLFALLFYPEDGDSTFIRIFGEHLVDYMPSHWIFIITVVRTSISAIIYFIEECRLLGCAV
jgi:hypothetical protein